MRYLGLITISAAILSFGLILGAAPQQAAAGACAEIRGVPNKGCVTTRDLKGSAVTSGKVKNESLTGKDIKDGTVGFADLAPDAVFMRTVVVSPVGPSASDNCNELRAALASITDNSAANPYLLYLEPGVYDCGSTPLAMKSFVGIRGAGERLTEITGSVPSSSTAGTVVASSDSTLGHLSVTNSFTGTGESRALISQGTDIAVSHVTLTAAAASILSNGAFFLGGAPTLEHVTVIAAATGVSHAIIHTAGGTLEMDSVTAISLDPGPSNASGLFNNASDVVTARNSVFVGATRAVLIQTGSTANLISTQLDGGLEKFAGLGTANCVGSYDGAFAPLDTDCTPLP